MSLACSFILIPSYSFFLFLVLPVSTWSFYYRAGTQYGKIDLPFHWKFLSISCELCSIGPGIMQTHHQEENPTILVWIVARREWWWLRRAIHRDLGRGGGGGSQPPSLLCVFFPTGLSAEFLQLSREVNLHLICCCCCYYYLFIYYFSHAALPLKTSGWHVWLIHPVRQVRNGKHD